MKIPTGFEHLSCSIKRTACERENLQLSKKILSWVSSHDLCWENKIDKRKRSIEFKGNEMWIKNPTGWRQPCSWPFIESSGVEVWTPVDNCKSSQ